VEARSKRWERVASGWYAPADRPACVEQRILDAACRLPHGGAVTGWAGLRWRGASFFDGLGPGGVGEVPVPLLVGTGNLRPRSGLTLSKIQLAPTEWAYLAGLPVATVQRALFDEVVRQCSEAGLVSGRHLSVDGTQITANASVKSLRPIDSNGPPDPPPPQGGERAVKEPQPALLLQKPDTPFDLLLKHLEGEQGHGQNYDTTATRAAHNR
jgi:hypothetical protein